MRVQDQQFVKLAQHSIRIALIDGDRLAALRPTLQEQGYQTVLLSQDADLISELAGVNILLLDIATARQPRSGQYVRVPTILVFSANPKDELPPWLRARHISLHHLGRNPDDVLNQLNRHFPHRSPDFDIEPQKLDYLPLLFGITQFLSGQLDINDLFERVLELAPYLNGSFAALLVLEDEQVMYYRSTQPGREELNRTVGRKFAQRLVANGLEGWVLQQRQPAIVTSTRQDSRWLNAPYLPAADHAVVALPLFLSRVNASAVYLLGHDTPGHFTPDQLPLLEAAADQIGMALENAILFKNQMQRSVQLALINEVSQAATSILSLDAMLRTVVQAIRRSFTFYGAAIYLVNSTADWVELHAKSSMSQPAAGAEDYISTYRMEQGLVGWVAATRKTVVANDVLHEPRYIPASGQQAIRSELCVPIVLGTKPIGVLDLQSTQLDAFERYHVAALETLADQLAIAIENARLYDAIHRRVQELKTLNDIGQAITSSLDLQEILTLITSQAIQIMNVAAASVALLDEQRQDVWFAAASGKGADSVIGVRMARGRGVAGWVTEHGQPVIVPDVYTDQRFFPGIDEHSGFTTRSILCVPLQTKGHTIGAIEVMNKGDGTFNQDDQELLQALAAPAATAIENAQLYAEKTKTIERLAQTQSQLVQSAKLAAVGELAAGIAHEINNPLTSILGLTSLLLESPPGTTIDGEARDDLDMVNREAQRARDIVRGLLDFARTGSPKRQAADMNQLIEDAIFLVYTKSVSYKIDLEKSLSELPPLYLDINQVKQIVVNLLNNGVQAMLEDNNQGRPAKLMIATRANPNSQPPTITLTVSDTGPGIAPEHLDKIFDPFFTTKEVGQGTGLGLSISYSIIEQHGGAITVDSTPGQGTSFTVTLPVEPVSDQSQQEDSLWQANEF